MKGYSMRLLCALMALIIAACAMSSVSFTAVENEDVAAEAVDASEDIIASAAEETDAAVAATEAVTEAPTEAPTQAPTDPVVGKVTHLERDSYESDLCWLNWDAVAGADGYYVYICNADEGSTFTRIADVKTNTYTAKNLSQGTQYHFRVSAYIKYDGRIVEGPQTLKKTATQPGKVTGLTKWRSSDVIEMEWDRNPKATGYRIYRTSTESGNKEVLYKTIYGNKNTTFTESAVKRGRTYTYRVKSFRDLYDTSYSGKTASMTFLAGLSAPDYSIASRCQRVNLSWKANAYATAYEVYYSTSPDNSTFTKLYTTPRLYYNTTKLTKGKTYYFRVRPIYKKGSTTIEGTSTKKSAVVTTKAYGKESTSTYVEISIDQQHMWVYKNGKQIATTDIVTGTKGVSDTPKGYYSVRSKSRNIYLNGAGYSAFVNYWMAFIGSSYGIHDASWRSSYGNPIYKSSGSHGCVNTPKSSMVTIYNNIPTGTPVIIY